MFFTVATLLVVPAPTDCETIGGEQMKWLNQYSLYLLVVIFLLALTIRFWWIDQSPQGLLIDEAHFGYISYSLLETGKDEHGLSYPLVFKGFGDWKLPMQAYLLVPVIKTLGLTAMAVRLPAVMAGSLLVILIYWLLKELKLSTAVSLLGSLLVALSPWTFILSRFAYEANLALLFFVGGLIALLKMLNSSSWGWPVLSGLLFGLTWYTYIAYRPITLLFSLGIVIIAKLLHQLSWRSLLLFLGVLVLSVLPLFHPSWAASGTARFNQVGIFSDPGIVMEINENRTFCDEQLPRFWCDVLWNKPTVMAKELASRFMAVFAADFLFLNGDSQLIYQSVENFGQFYYWLAPVLLLGAISIFFSTTTVKLSSLKRWFVILGLVIMPLPSILAGQPQMVRLSAIIPFFIILLCLGLEFIFGYLSDHRFQNGLIMILMMALGLSSATFLTNFYTIHTQKNDLVYQSYLPEMFGFLETLPKADQIIIKPFFSDPIMAYAFYAQVEPRHYQEQVVLGKLEGSGFQHAILLDNYQVLEEPMINIGCRSVANDRQTYYVTNEYFDNPPINFVKKITSINGALGYAYVYDATAYASAHPEMCLD